MHGNRRGRGLAWPEVFLSSNDISRRVRQAVRAGTLREIGLRLYTPSLHEPLEVVVRRNLWRIVSLLAPGSVVGYRTALEARPALDGTVFLTGPTRYERDLPGLRIRVSKGPGVLPGDRPFLDGLHMASVPRALLEALGPGRKRGTGAVRMLTGTEAEARLEQLFLSGGEAALRRLRDEARVLARMLDASLAFERLNGITAVLLGSRHGSPTAPTAIARLAGRPYDADRAVLFEALFAHLRERPPAPLPPQPPPPEGSASTFATLAFFDAYFSNFIEGTEFEVEEAREIIFEGRIPTARPEDAHDILGTFALTGDPTWMTRGIADDGDFASFRDRLRDAHAQILQSRPDKRPGQFKEAANRAGDTRFVAPDLVEGTLRRGFDVVCALDAPFQRAAALMFVISEAHPFDDGNGRVARAFMNAELVCGAQPRIIIPSVYRDDYLTGLRVLSRQHVPDPFVEVLRFAQRYVAAIDWISYGSAEPVLRATHAFDRPSPDVRLLLPRAAHGE